MSGADDAFGDLDLVDLNVILHRADGEEKDATGETSILLYGDRSVSKIADNQVAMGHTLSPTTAKSSTAVSKGGCTL